LPEHPFDPAAAPTAAGIPLLIGTCRDEMTLFTAAIPGFDLMTDEALPMVAAMLLQGDATELVGTYRRTRPDATAPQRAVAIATDTFRVGSIRVAERKIAADPAPVYMYRLDFETPVLGGKLGAPHALDIGFMFDNLHASPLHGDRPGSQELADRMSEAWLAFARHGDPGHAGLPSWPAYDLEGRSTMIFDAECRVVDDPDGEERQAWEGRLGGI
jgi:para-nitrobenzyl esterase